MKHYDPRYRVYPSNLYYPYSSSLRQFPPVNTQIFVQSANKTLLFLKDAEKIVKKIATSEDFSKNLMILAQQSKLSEVTKMLIDIGLNTTPTIRFTPSGLVINFSDAYNEPNCCLLQIKIRWGM
ncbi:hypothetical protein J6TS2_50190 [Heyndrickxia sporothermodurans]|nr:hypothetical protein J6TS2_50190 [Heyndrickxia sporothermodurans]